MRAARRLLLLLLTLTALYVPAGSARASISIALAFDALVHDSNAVGVMTPVEQRAVWEDGRIVTYTRVHVDEAVAGDLKSGDETWIASLGGIVGDVGQTVDGEPPLHVGRPSLLFLRPDHSPGVRVVTARAQGCFSIRVDASTKERRFQTSNGMGMLLPPKTGARGRSPSEPGGLAAAAQRTAAEVIADRPANDVVREIAAAWGRLHGK
jgi:hypothetical protein